MRKLRIACILLLIETVALLPLHQKVEGATGNYDANQHQIWNSDLFTMAGGRQVPEPINITNHSAALSATPAVCLVRNGASASKDADPRWDFGESEASITTEYGEVNYKFQIPERICPGGSDATLKFEAKASRTGRLGARITLGGEVDWDGQYDVGAVAEPGEVKDGSGTVTIKPRGGYSEGYHPVIRVHMDGGHTGLVITFSYTVEQASNGSGMRLEYNTDRPGQDYKNFNLSEARPELCVDVGYSKHFRVNHGANEFVRGTHHVSGGGDKTVKLWDVATRQELCTLTVPSEIYSVAFSPDNKALAVATSDGKVKLWFAASKDETEHS